MLELLNHREHVRCICLLAYLLADIGTLVDVCINYNLNSRQDHSYHHTVAHHRTVCSHRDICICKIPEIFICLNTDKAYLCVFASNALRQEWAWARNHQTLVDVYRIQFLLTKKAWSSPSHSLEVVLNEKDGLSFWWLQLHDTHFPSTGESRGMHLERDS